MAKLDGTNGLIQQYDYQTPTTGFSYTFASGTQTLIMNPAGTLATGTITMPAAPADGMSITFESTQTITAITVQGNTGQSIVGAPTQIVPNQPVSFIYRITNTTWYPLAGAGAVAPLVLGTAQNSTSGTSIDFTSIPSWAKRITVMFNGVSTNGTAYLRLQLGAGSVQTTGYNSTGTYTGSAIGAAESTSGFDSYGDNSASAARSGTLVFTLLGSNTWTMTGAYRYAISAFGVLISGSVTLSGTLDRVRITTTNGTDTFDAGSINIMYE